MRVARQFASDWLLYMSPTLLLTYILLPTAVTLFCLFVKLLQARKRANPDSAGQDDSGVNLANYERCESLLTPGERAFFPALRQA